MIIDTRMLSEDIFVDVDKNEDFMSIEIWKASQNAILPISKDIAAEVKASIEKCA